jgi:hypothetical protein
MNRADAFEALSRERPLTAAEVDQLWREVRLERLRAHPSQTPEGKRARYLRCKDVVNARKRERWANDPEWRELKRARDKAWRERMKAQEARP